MPGWLFVSCLAGRLDHSFSGHFMYHICYQIHIVSQLTTYLEQTICLGMLREMSKKITFHSPWADTETGRTIYQQIHSASIN